MRDLCCPRCADLPVQEKEVVSDSGSEEEDDDEEENGKKKKGVSKVAEVEQVDEAAQLAKEHAEIERRKKQKEDEDAQKKNRLLAATYVHPSSPFQHCILLCYLY